MFRDRSATSLEVSLAPRPTFRIGVLAVLFALALAAPAAASVPVRPAPRSVAPRGTAAPARSNPGSPFTIFYGDDHVFGLEIPRGWVADDSSGLGSRIRVVLYPRGQHWKDAPVVMYENALHQDPRSPLSLTAMVERDVQQFKLHAPKGRVKSDRPIRTHKGQVAEVRLFSPEGGAPVEAVAYLEQKGFVEMLVLQAQRPEGLAESMATFRAMIETFEIVGTDIQTPTHTRRGR